MSSASDEDILAFALTLTATVVTLDADFHAILAVFEASGPSVVRIRLQGLGALALVEVLERIAGRRFGYREGEEGELPKLPIGGAD